MVDQMSLPDFYPSPLHLPFNAAAVRARFSPAPHDADPGGDGPVVLLRGQEMVVDWAGDTPRFPEGSAQVGSSLYIGNWDGRPCRVLRWEKDAAPPPGCTIENLLANEPRIPIDLLTLGGVAGQILHWEKNSRFCSRCGGDVAHLPGEWGKKCARCGYDHFPHIHPCVIVLIRRPGEVLLARKANWPTGRYGLVAGFVDFGECFEEAVLREVREETGVEVRDVRYVGSQSWPFPSQVMAGFTAEYAGGEIRVEEKELEDARWFPVDDLPTLPPRRSIARWLLDHGLWQE